MKRIMIILNAVVYNRGSEALVRGISEICKDYYRDGIITLVSSEENFGSDIVNIENVDKYQRKITYNNKSVLKYISKFFEKIRMDKIAYEIRYKKLFETAKEQDIIIVVGADNYDIRYHMQKSLNGLNTVLRKKTNAKLILYDCSIDKRDVTELFVRDTKNFDYLTVRESISMSNLKGKVDENKIFYFPDPAFIMKPKKIELDGIFKKYDIVGVNVSDLITNKKYGSNCDIIINAYHKMIEYILKNTNMGIMLIPHVMNNSDLSTLRVLYSKYVDNERVVLMDNEALNARELKYLISNCKLYIGARTHSTIAAYSSCVPTLVLGYSVKSKGIARDLFGTEKEYVLPVSDLDDEEYLVRGFKWLMENQDNIKKQLQEKIPAYIRNAENTYEILKKCEESE